MPGAPDPVYVEARRALLDALEALQGQRQAIVLAGAQAVYLYTGDAEFSVAEFTRDADLVVEPARLATDPALEAAMTSAGFRLHESEPGIWLSPDGFPVDLIVPESLAGAGRRAARLPGHGKRAARRALGVEAALVDREVHEIDALDPRDPRRFEIDAAGPAALLVAKVHKIADRSGEGTRLKDKDALDVFRLLTAVETMRFEDGIRRLRESPVADSVTRNALALFTAQFGAPGGVGIAMLLRALPLDDPAVIQARCRELARDVLAAVE
jgi:hypothetical protein